MGWNPTDIEIIETLDTIDRRGSFAKAAKELNKSISAHQCLMVDGRRVSKHVARGVDGDGSLH
jgi:hypothetical protein